MLNISKTIYAGWNTGSQKYELPEAEVIPLGESANEKKKLSKVTATYTSLAEHDNIPLPGFTLYTTNRKNWGSPDQTWLVIDPRGFLVRITSENLEKILHVTGITEGLIQQECVWARENTETKMRLVPVSAVTFTEAVRNTELIEGKVDMKDVHIGDTVLLQNQLQGVYMGTVSMYGPVNDYSTSTEYKPQAYLRRQIIQVTPGKYHHQTDLKILKVIQKAATPITREESVKEMNNDIIADIAYFTNSTNMTGNQYGVRGVVKLISAAVVPKVLMTFEEVTLTEAHTLFNIGLLTSDFGILLLEDSRQNRFLVDYPYMYSANAGISADKFDVTKLVSCNLIPTEKLFIAEKRQSLWGSYRTKPANYSLDKFTKFYKITKHVKDETYV